MAFTNFDTKEINCKILYLGPQGAGKSMNLRKILELSSPHLELELTSLAPNVSSGREYFEFLPISLGKVLDFHIKLHLYTLPLNSLFDSLTSVVLKGVDGFVFVADSRVDRLSHNVEALESAKKILGTQGIVVSNTPSLIQFNKRDDATAVSSQILSSHLNPYQTAEIEASASKGQGVLETLKEIAKQVIKGIANSEPAVNG